MQCDFCIMSLRHCKLSSHYHYKNHITSVFYIHFFITHHRKNLEIILKFRNMTLMYYCSYDTIKNLKINVMILDDDTKNMPTTFCH